MCAMIIKYCIYTKLKKTAGEMHEPLINRTTQWFSGKRKTLLPLFNIVYIITTQHMLIYSEIVFWNNYFENFFRYVSI